MKFLCKRVMPNGRSHVHHATPDEIQKMFLRYREELHGLALFLTADQALAEACMVDARAVAATQNRVSGEWLERWARRAIIRSAIDLQKARLSSLGAVYERRPCPHPGHASLAPAVAEKVKEQGGSLLCLMDALCRCALVLRGIENTPPHDAALLLGISRCALNAAYCAALETLAIGRERASEGCHHPGPGES